VKLRVLPHGSRRQPRFHIFVSIALEERRQAGISTPCLLQPDKRTFIDATVTTLALTDWKR
jgi:hypothetical protein